MDEIHHGIHETLSAAQHWSRDPGAETAAARSYQA